MANKYKIRIFPLGTGMKFTPSVLQQAENSIPGFMACLTFSVKSIQAILLQFVHAAKW